LISTIDSCIGRYDGQAYEALLERARLNPTNRYKVRKKRSIDQFQNFIYLLLNRFIQFGNQLNKIQLLNFKNLIFSLSEEEYF
jgi:hypothetical protein